MIRGYVIKIHIQRSLKEEVILSQQKRKKIFSSAISIDLIWTGICLEHQCFFTDSIQTNFLHGHSNKNIFKMNFKIKISIVFTFYENLNKQN